MPLPTFGSSDVLTQLDQIRRAIPDRPGEYRLDGAAGQLPAAGDCGGALPQLDLTLRRAGATPDPFEDHPKCRIMDALRSVFRLRWTYE